MRREASTSSEWSDAENPHTSSLCSDMASTKLLPINSAEPQAAPPQTPRHPHITSLPRATVQDPVHALQNSPHPNQPSHIPGILTGKVKAPNRDRFFLLAQGLKQPHSLVFPR